MSLDSGPNNSFSYSGPADFCKGGATPVTSVTGLHHVSSSLWQPPGLTSPPAMQTLNAEQSTEILNLVVKCQALSTELAKQFATLPGLEAMHRAAVHATAHETINTGWMAWNASCLRTRLGIKSMRKPCSSYVPRLTKLEGHQQPSVQPPVALRWRTVCFHLQCQENHSGKLG